MNTFWSGNGKSFYSVGCISFIFCWLHIFHVFLVKLSLLVPQYHCGDSPAVLFKEMDKKLLSTSPKEYSDFKICEWCKHILFRTKWQQNSTWVTMSTLIFVPSRFNFLENDYSCNACNALIPLKWNCKKKIKWKDPFLLQKWLGGPRRFIQSDTLFSLEGS